MTTNSLSTCCESGGRTLADSGPTASAQASVYCPVYESRLLATARHELNSAAALGVYGAPYGGSQGYGNYVTYGSEASAFYSLVCREGVLCPYPSSHFPQRQPRRQRREAPGPRTAAGGRRVFSFAPPSLAPGNTPSSSPTPPGCGDWAGGRCI